MRDRKRKLLDTKDELQSRKAKTESLQSENNNSDEKDFFYEIFSNHENQPEFLRQQIENGKLKQVHINYILSQQRISQKVLDVLIGGRLLPFIMEYQLLYFLKVLMPNKYRQELLFKKPSLMEFENDLKSLLGRQYTKTSLNNETFIDMNNFKYVMDNKEAKNVTREFHEAIFSATKLTSTLYNHNLESLISFFDDYPHFAIHMLKHLNILKKNYSNWIEKFSSKEIMALSMEISKVAQKKMKKTTDIESNIIVKINTEALLTFISQDKIAKFNRFFNNLSQPLLQKTLETFRLMYLNIPRDIAPRDYIKTLKTLEDNMYLLGCVQTPKISEFIDNAAKNYASIVADQHGNPKLQDYFYKVFYLKFDPMQYEILVQKIYSIVFNLNFNCDPPVFEKNVSEIIQAECHKDLQQQFAQIQLEMYVQQSGFYLFSPIYQPITIIDAEEIKDNKSNNNNNNNNNNQNDHNKP